MDKLTVAVCMLGDLPLADAFLLCGPIQITVDRGMSYRGPGLLFGDMDERFSSIRTDREIVRCVQGQVRFGVRAYI